MESTIQVMFELTPLQHIYGSIFFLPLSLSKTSNWSWSLVFIPRLKLNFQGNKCKWKKPESFFSILCCSTLMLTFPLQFILTLHVSNHTTIHGKTVHTNCSCVKVYEHIKTGNIFFYPNWIFTLWKHNISELRQKSSAAFQCKIQYSTQ